MATPRTRLGFWAFWVVALGASITLGACGAAAQTPVQTATSASPGGSSTSSPTPAPGVTVTTLTVLARTMAASNDDSGVTAGEAVLTTRQAAVTATSGDLVNSDEPSYLVQLQGHFTALDASVPPGGSLPTGTFLTFIVDASSGHVTVWGVSNRKANLSALGSVIALSL
jgi:hypothetical protein